MTGREFLEYMLDPIKDKLGPARYQASTGDIKDTMEDPDEFPHDPYQEEDILVELSRKAAAGRVLLLLDGLDEVHGVGTLDSIKLPAGMEYFHLDYATISHKFGKINFQKKRVLKMLKY